MCVGVEILRAAPRVQRLGVGTVMTALKSGSRHLCLPAADSGLLFQTCHEEQGPRNPKVCAGEHHVNSSTWSWEKASMQIRSANKLGL